jgi:hypothetical protein
MKAVVKSISLWLVSMGLWTPITHIVFNEPWTGPGDVVAPALFLGAPAVVAGILIDRKLLPWITRRSLPGPKPKVAAVAASGVASMLLVVWPVLVLGGDIGELVSVGIEPYGLLYLIYGLLLGAWHVTFEEDIAG